VYWYSYILSCSILKEFKQSIIFIKSLIEKNPYSHLAWHYLGLTYLKAEDHLNAIEAFDYAILINETATKSYIYKAESLAALSFYDLAIETCKLTFEFEEPHAALYYDIGEFYEKSDKLDKALSYFNKALVKDSEMSDAWFSIALILDFQGKQIEASYNIKKAVEKNNTNTDYLFSYAEIHEKLGFIKEAEIAYRKVTEIDNYDSESWLNYSNLLYQQKYKQEAVETLHNALKLNPNNAELNYRLSAYLIDSGDETNGLKFFKTALEIDFDQHKDVFQYMPSVKNNENLLYLLHNFKN
jgi:tetratricopeptide (TPR) repeat protein